MKNYIESNFSVNQLKGILKELHKQLAYLERKGNKIEVREKMLDIEYYNSMLYKIVEWKEYFEIQNELDEIRNM
jgi:chromosome segregation ATPase